MSAERQDWWQTPERKAELHRQRADLRLARVRDARARLRAKGILPIETDAAKDGE